jgi:hypothetical protein
VIALGDMAVCFNHLIDENTDFLYRRLADSDLSVKRTCLMTLTFLILAGQVKVKGQLGEMAKCLEDTDKRIADLARMFFGELSTKDNAVYNHFVDMFSLLSAGNLEEDSFKRIIKFLLGFVEKVRISFATHPIYAYIYSFDRISTRDSWRTSWQHVLPVARVSANGMMLPLHSANYSIRTRRSPRLLLRASSSCRLLRKYLTDDVTCNGMGRMAHCHLMGTRATGGWLKIWSCRRWHRTKPQDIIVISIHSSRSDFPIRLIPCYLKIPDLRSPIFQPIFHLASPKH